MATGSNNRKSTLQQRIYPNTKAVLDLIDKHEEQGDRSRPQHLHTLALAEAKRLKIKVPKKLQKSV